MHFCRAVALGDPAVDKNPQYFPSFDALGAGES